jgi:hypothetical protein
MIPGMSGEIPYAGEQGHYSAVQGIKVPCSAECKDISRLKPLIHFAARKRGGQKVGV